MAKDNANDSTSAQMMANQMPSTPNRAGRMNTAAVSNTKVRTVAMIAETFSYLCRFFRNATGQSMMEFRRKQR